MTEPDLSAPLPKPFPAVQQEFPARWFFLIWMILAITATVPFWVIPVAPLTPSANPDMVMLHYWYQPTGAGFFSHENDAIWRLFYHAAPIMVGILALSGLCMTFAGFLKPQWLYLRPMGLYLILTVAMGPGLFVNAIGKEYAGRARPRQLAATSDAVYRPPFKFGKPGDGKSFPCGHCSVGFSFAALWLLVRRRNLWLGRATLAGGLGLGFLMGMGRMAAGAHFLSDVFWSGLLTMLAAGLTYYYILRMPARWVAWAEGAVGTGAQAAAATMSRSQKARAALVFGLLGAVLVFCLLLASPVHEDPKWSRPIAGEDPAILRLEVASARTEILYSSGESDAVAVQGSVRGFGLPSNKVRLRGSLDKEDKVPVVTVQFTRKGLFTDYEAKLQVTVNTDKVRRIEIEQPAGELIFVTPTPAGLDLDLSLVGPKVAQNEIRLQQPLPANTNNIQ